MLTATHLPPAALSNSARVFPESRNDGTTVHADQGCTWAAVPLTRVCTAIQAAVWLTPHWCPACTRRPA